MLGLWLGFWFDYGRRFWFWLGLGYRFRLGLGYRFRLRLGYRLRLGFRFLHDGLVVEIDALVQYHRLKLRERLVDQFLHRRVGRKSNLPVALNEHALTGIHVDAFARLNVDDLERA